MLIEILQLRLQELHERGDGLQREERGVGEGTGWSTSSRAVARGTEHCWLEAAGQRGVWKGSLPQ